MKKCIQFLFFFVLLSATSMANKKSGHIYLTGSVDSSVVKRFQCQSIQIKVRDFNKRLLNQEEIYTVKLNIDGRFSTEIKTGNAYLHISFWVVNQHPQYHTSVTYPIHFPFRPDRNIDESYLIKNGDSLNIDFKLNGLMRARGDGSEKVNCMYQIYSIPPLPQAISLRSTQLYNTMHFQDRLRLQFETLDQSLAIRNKILDSYKEELTEYEWAVLSLDVYAETNYNSLDKYLLNGFNLPSVQESATNAMQSFYRSKLLQPNMPKSWETYATASPNFMDYLLSKEWNDHKIFSLDFQKGNSFKVVYEKIQSKYHGLLADKLSALAIWRLSYFFEEEIKESFPSLLAGIQDKTIKRTMLDWERGKNYAFPFSYQDTGAKIHRLRDFKGKVVVIDFWFTGCHWCKIVNAAMKQVAKRYSNRSDVVFLSVSSDKEAETWKKSLSNEVYTSQDNINLYTNGLGMKDPLMMYYRFNGAPTQLIIDKQGKLVSSNPPRPDVGLEFIHDPTSGEYRVSNSKNVYESSNMRKFLALIDGCL